MKAKEVMKTLSISRQTLCNYVKQGLIKIDSTINGKYRYNKESVYKLLNNTPKRCFMKDFEEFIHNHYKTETKEEFIKAVEDVKFRVECFLRVVSRERNDE